MKKKTCLRGGKFTIFCAATFFLFTSCAGLHKKQPLIIPPPSQLNQVDRESLSLELGRDNKLFTEVFQNGLRAIIVEMPESTISYGAIAVQVGGRYEPDSHAGISHLLEHMLFKEEATSKPLTRIREKGGRVNAITELELTTYYFQVRPEHFKDSMEALASLVLQPEFREDELEKEREVVVEELLMIKNDPRSLVLSDIIKEIFPESPIANIVIGDKRSIMNVTMEDLSRFHSSYYVPDNMVVIAAGNLKADDTASYLHTLFGGLERRPIPEHTFSPPRVAVHELERMIPVNQEFLAVGAITPGIGSEDFPAMVIFDIMLGSAVSSRLYRRIVIDEGMTDELIPYSYSLSDSGIWALLLSLHPGDTRKALAIIREEIDSIREGELSEDELMNAKKVLVSGLRLALDRPEDVASFELQNLFFRGRAMPIEEYMEDIRQVKREDVINTARRYFGTENLVTISLKPAKGLSRWYLALKFIATKKL